ncbi:MAG: hypothetical protein WBA09_22550 [Candidatus Acidiferrum sp.]
MATQIVKPESSEFATVLARLQADAQNIAVKTAEDCLAAKTTQQQVRRLIKDIHAKLDPFVQMAKNNYDDAKTERAKWIDPAEAVDAALAQKVKDYERLEREKTEAEERRINEERRRKAAEEAEAQRKRDEAAAADRRREEQARIAEAQKAGELKKREAEKMRKEAEERERRDREQAARDAEAAKATVQDVKVAPSIPKVAGVPSRRNYKFRIIDASRIPRQYLCPDEQKIGRDVRDWKKVGEVIPGVEAFED